MRNRSNSIGTTFLLALLLLIAKPAMSQPSPGYKCSPPAKLNDGLRTGTLRSEKLDEAGILTGMREIRKGTYGNIHSVLILRHGKLVCEEYFAGPDENNHVGEIGVVAHNGETLHDLRSISKSVVALAVLVAHSQGKIKDLDQPIFSFFPEYASHAQGEKKSITVRHALTMTSGLEWNEGFSYSNPENTAFQMNSAPNTIDFVLSRKLVNKPGTTFEYNGGMTQLLAAIIKKTTGSDIESFAKKHLLTPLGITNFQWATMKGEPDADSGLRLRSRDIAKIGLLLVNGGKWKGKQIVPANLVDDAVAEHIRIPPGPGSLPGDIEGYGYQIWRVSYMVDDENRVDLIELTGNGGQKVHIDRKTSIMVVVTAGDYGRHNLKKSAFDIYGDILFPAVLDRDGRKTDK